jgi:hypothetical protein
LAILSSSDYAEIRNVLDVSKTADHIPDAVIGRQAIIGAAEDEVYRRYEAADPATFPGSLSAAQQAKVRRAAIYLTAANLVYAVPMVTQESYTGVGMYNRQLAPVAEVANNLRAMAHRELDSLAGETTYPTFFARATGPRGQGAVG